MTRSTADAVGLLTQIARGVVALSAHSDRGGATPPPYPHEMQSALDQLVLWALRKNHTPPAGVPDLVFLCTGRTLAQWAAMGIGGITEPTQRLVHGVAQVPTRACLEITGQAEFADRLFAAAVAELDAADVARARAFLERNVVMSNTGHLDLMNLDPRSMTAVKAVRHLYEPVPARLTSAGEIALCPTCRLPALSAELPEHGTVWCEAEVCPRDKPVTDILGAGDVLLLHRALRLFLALPSLVERSCVERLRDAGTPLLRRSTGTYTSRLGGTDVVIRFYDRTCATHLAWQVVRDLVTVAVLPETALDHRFRRTFESSLPDDTDISLLSDEELVLWATEEEKANAKR
ncbi:hypothetical protein BBK82_26625 [Lentzea guizhouensis]|uniref:pPIWI-RE three-gene island domain-containing protein n=1 Tax=Lentzea guizhouensis TaxID=1586287 RepID=A0A1B2HN21_9PSEU|nr:hypothetical protein [Lentzea guizhouensis]ANZ39119.1 hypothetical protein BBK82_26625 [Lentzea guizhouensis]